MGHAYNNVAELKQNFQDINTHRQQSCSPLVKKRIHTTDNQEQNFKSGHEFTQMIINVLILDTKT